MKKLSLLTFLFAFTSAFSASLVIAENGAVGTKLVLEATSDGSPAPTFEWFRTSSPPSATPPTKVGEGPTLTIDKLAVTDAGTYTVKATNPFGSAVSPDFVLQVGTAPTAPVIKSTFSNITVTKQSRVELGVVAVGNDLKYKWQKGSATLSGETNATLIIPKANPSNAGTYAVTVSNPGGSVTSTAKLTVR